MKCHNCKKDKPESEFYFRVGVNKNTPNGNCKQCQSDINKQKQKLKKIENELYGI